MAKIRLLQSFTGAVDGNYNPQSGDVIDVSEPAAADLVRRGRAERVKSKPVKRTKVVPEAAVTGPAETAAALKAESRGR